MASPENSIIGLLQTLITAAAGIISGYLLQHRRTQNEDRKGSEHQKRQGRRAVDDMVDSYEKALKNKDKIHAETIAYKDGIIVVLTKRLEKYEQIGNTK